VIWGKRAEKFLPLGYTIMFGEVQFGFPVYDEERGVVDGEDDYASIQREHAEQRRVYHERFRQQHVGLPELSSDDDDDVGDEPEPIMGEDGLFFFAAEPVKKSRPPKRQVQFQEHQEGGGGVHMLTRKERPRSFQSHVALVHELLNAIIRHGEESISGGEGIEQILKRVLDEFPPETEVAKQQRTYKDDVSGFLLVPEDDAAAIDNATLDQVGFAFASNAIGQYPFAIVLVGCHDKDVEHPTILLMYGSANVPCFVMESRWDTQVMLAVCGDAFDTSQFVSERYTFDKLVSYQLSRGKRPATTTPELPRDEHVPSLPPPRDDGIPFDDEGCAVIAPVPPPGPVPRAQETSIPIEPVVKKEPKPSKVKAIKKRTIVAKVNDVATEEFATTTTTGAKKAKTDAKKPIALASMVEDSTTTATAPTPPSSVQEK
jgi:hypothetical protein